MNVITTNPIISANEFVPTDWYSGADASTRRARRAVRQKQRASKGTFAQRAGDTLTKIGESGILQSVGTLASGRGVAPSESPLDTMPPLPPPPPEPKMSNGAKIAIGVGVVAVLGVGIYFLTKKKK